MSFRSGARVWTVVAACFGASVATSWTGACTTMVVDFAAHDGGGTPEASVAPFADASLADVLGEVPTPDSSSVSPREVTPPSDNPFMGVPMVDGPARYIQYKCCDVTGGNFCSVWIQGDDLTCRDAATWTMSAVHDCESRGLIAAGIGLHVGC